MEQRVRPEQVGCGTRGGAEAAVHAVRSFLEEGKTASKILLKLDFKNAFNTIRRDVLIQIVHDTMPMYLPFVWQSTVKVGVWRHVLESASGVQQGDPLGSSLFCLAIERLTKGLTSPLNVWYLDDDTIGVDVDCVVSDLQIGMTEELELGLELNTSTCELFPFGGSHQDRVAISQKVNLVCPGILLPSRSELSLLGAPLMEEGLEEAVRAKTGLMKVFSKRLCLMHAHQALFLLKNCLCLLKLLCILQCSPLWKFPEVLKEFDEVVRSSLAEITNVQMSAEPWRQATFPVGLGGLGSLFCFDPLRSKTGALHPPWCRFGQRN
ncbi:hypothetical protein RvY_18322 [Ramazzottius varieornatus]|uniref:Reverse transcriptase domain-containing protein n=1 Tax=Ramazzottius varieornatus TaxID=947166 RepID=A0A1D1W5B9_RAMVA|nr:hypothetical protein RvY_18322 [Ramazzottius varieornatus]